MKRLLFAAIAATTFSSALAADVGVSVSIGQPGFYGQIDIGNAPLPVRVYGEPVVIYRDPVVVTRQPLYLHVPPGHAKHWRKHCREYNACGQPVYFVQERWYNEVYVPYYRDHRDNRDHRYYRDNKDRRGDWGGRNDRHDDRRGRGDDRNGRGR